MGRRTPIRYGRLGITAVLAFILSQGGFLPGSESVTQIALGQTGQELREDATTLDILGVQNQFETIADKVSPSVVAVSASEVKGSAADAIPVEDMSTAKLHAALNRGVRTVGTGFVVDSNGYILTNDHVVEHARQIWITTDRGKVYPALVVGSDPLLDIALLKTPAQDLTPVKFATDQTLRRGMWSIALGNPYGLATDGQMSMAVGVVSAVDRSLPKLSNDEHRMYSGLIQTTAEINPGNSGGPLVDIHGNVIGINVAVILPEKQTNGIGFAIPANQRLLRAIRELQRGEPITFGYLGVSLTDPSDAERRHAGVSNDVGSEIQKIVPNSPAARSELQPGDIIASINGQMVHDTEQLAWMITDAPIEHTSNLMVFRNGSLMSVPVQFGARPKDMVAHTDEAPRLRWNGMLVTAVPTNWMQQGGAIVLAVDPGSPAALQGVQQGTIITGVAGKIISNLQEFQQIVSATPIEHCALQTAEQGNPTERVAAASGK